MDEYNFMNTKKICVFFYYYHISEANWAVNILFSISYNAYLNENYLYSYVCGSLYERNFKQIHLKKTRWS